MSEKNGGGVVLGVDVDSTLYDLYPAIRAAARNITGEDFAYEEISFDSLQHRFGANAAHRVFKAALNPRRVEDRQPYPGVRDALDLIRGTGVALHFVSQNVEPKAMRAPLRRWLNAHVGGDFGLKVMDGDKLPFLKKIGAFGMIDDRPDFLERVADAGLFAATKVHPWNRGVVERREDVRGFDSWGEVPFLVQAFLKAMFEAERAKTVGRGEDRDGLMRRVAREHGPKVAQGLRSLLLTPGFPESVDDERAATYLAMLADKYPRVSVTDTCDEYHAWIMDNPAKEGEKRNYLSRLRRFFDNAENWRKQRGRKVGARGEREESEGGAGADEEEWARFYAS